jgi:hypothetical protein
VLYNGRGQLEKSERSKIKEKKRIGKKQGARFFGFA